MDAARARGFHDSAVSSTRTVVNDLPSRAAPMRADRVSSHGLNLISFIQPSNDAPMNSPSTQYALLTAAISLATSNGLLAETAATPATGSDKLEEIVVKGVNLEDQVSPLQRKVTSVFGLELSVLDTPRAVTEINAAQIRDQSIVDVTDFVKIGSSAYTNDQFGVPNLPFLRGQSAEVFQNGMLRTPRSDGQPLSFNSVEGFDIVKGPASVVYGPTGNVGGYLNPVTKRPDFHGPPETLSPTPSEYNNPKRQ